MKFLDIFKNSRPVFNMAERQMRMAATQPFHKIGPFLKGKVKVLRGYAYDTGWKAGKQNEQVQLAMMPRRKMVAYWKSLI